MSLGLFALAFVGSAVGLWLVSQITETLRPVTLLDAGKSSRKCVGLILRGRYHRRVQTRLGSFQNTVD